MSPCSFYFVGQKVKGLDTIALEEVENQILQKFLEHFEILRLALRGPWSFVYIKTFILNDVPILKSWIWIWNQQHSDNYVTHIEFQLILFSLFLLLLVY